MEGDLVERIQHHSVDLIHSQTFRRPRSRHHQCVLPLSAPSYQLVKETSEVTFCPGLSIYSLPSYPTAAQSQLLTCLHSIRPMWPHHTCYSPRPSLVRSDDPTRASDPDLLIVS
ncbi:unnamed protein product [Protopolystoma xenopodis]|uniref:Uncharacterized protein n=1 Tax=Protopolystoma xenopodis TaxID=117903 RepID=A0A448XKJ4_9PLAT|nr:unnamed protein product [Protopolystoma xenopodis]